jgi:hypothetical protein
MLLLMKGRYIILSKILIENLKEVQGKDPESWTHVVSAHITN